MRHSLALITLTVSAFFLFAPAAEPGQAMKCAECGMAVDLASKFSATLEGAGKAILPFCDIGDLLIHLNRTSLPPSAARVRDRETGEWISADAAWYVHNEKEFRTPMRWGIAAFRDASRAARFGTPRDITQIREAVQ